MRQYPNSSRLAFQLGRAYSKNNDFTAALAQFQKAAAQGNVPALNGLGVMHQNGNGVPQDYAEAERLFRKAADQGNAAALNNLGFMYQNGNGVPQDYSEAVKLYRKAADQGNAVAFVNLGFMYQNGDGVPQDYAEAKKWYRKAAARGNVTAQNNLAALDGRSAPTSAWIGTTPPSSEQQTRAQADFQAHVNARAAKCTTGDKQMCLLYAGQKEVELRVFCENKYASAARQIWDYKTGGWPAEMTAEHISLPVDLIIPLVRAGYSGKWKSVQDFNDEAQRRCLNGDFF